MPAEALGDQGADVRVDADSGLATVTLGAEADRAEAERRVGQFAMSCRVEGAAR